MDRKQRRFSLMLLSFTLFASCLMAILAMNVVFTQKAKADDAMFANQEFQIRLATPSSDISGLRFVVTIDAAETAGLSNPEYGVLVAKTADLNGGDLDFSSVSSGVATKVAARVFTEESDTQIVYQIVINGIPESAYGTSITVVPYIIDGDEKIVASHGQSYSIAQAASILINHGSDDTGIKGYIDKVMETGTFAAPASVELEKGDNEQVSVTITPSYLTPTYVSSDPSVFTVDNGGVVTGVAVGNANLTVKLGSAQRIVPVGITRIQLANPGMYYDYDEDFEPVSNESYRIREHLDTYQGATDVLHIDAIKLLNIPVVKNAVPLYSQSYYEKHDTLVLRMQQSSSSKLSSYNAETPSGDQDITSAFTVNDIAAYKWIEVEIDLDTFLNYYDDLKTRQIYGYTDVREVFYDALITFNKVTVTSNVENVFVGIPYTVNDNAATAFDAVGVELYDFTRTVLMNGVEVKLTENSYTPTESGRLEVIYTAVDEDGVLYRGRYFFEVDEPGMLLNFSDRTRNRTEVANSVAEVNYYESYAGVDGVTNVNHTNGSCSGYLWNYKYAPFTGSYYTYYDTICVKFHGDSAKNGYNATIKSRNSQATIVTVPANKLSNKWLEITGAVPANISNIVSNLKIQGIQIAGAGAVNVYYSSVYLAKAVTVTSNVGNVFTIGSPVAFDDNASTVMSGMTITREVTLSGLDVALNSGNTSFTPTAGGTYHVIVKGVDSSGRLHRGEYDIHVGNPGMLYDFSRRTYDIENENYFAETVQDENGDNVLHIRIKKDGVDGTSNSVISGVTEPIYSACFDASYYSGYDTVVVEAKTINGYKLIFTAFNGTTMMEVATSGNNGKWNQYTCTSTLLSNFDLVARKGLKIWQGKINDAYIRSIYFCYATTVTGTVTSGTVGNEITLSDDAATVMSGKVITREVKYNGNDVELTAGAFTPTVAGTYTVVVKGVDANNKLYRGTYTITVS